MHAAGPGAWYSSSSHSSVPSCSVTGAFTFTGAASSYLTATSRTGLVGGGSGFTLSAWVYRTLSGNSWDRLIDFGNGAGMDNVRLRRSNLGQLPRMPGSHAARDFDPTRAGARRLSRHEFSGEAWLR